MPSDAEVLDRLRLLVDGGTSLDEFEDWFIEHELEEDTPLQRQVAAVLAESAGNVEDEVAVHDLAALIAPRVIIIGSGTVVTDTVPVVEGANEPDSRTSLSVTESVPYSVPA